MEHWHRLSREIVVSSVLENIENLSRHNPSQVALGNPA